MDKIPIKDILAAIDLGAKNVWDEFSEEQKKSISFFLLNRYVSSIEGTSEEQQLAVLRTNEYFNKNWNFFSKDPKLLWQSLCAVGRLNKGIRKHPWIGLKQKIKNSINKKFEKTLLELYPSAKHDDINALMKILSEKQLLKLIEDHGIDTTKVNWYAKNK
tara:strand:+ start:611 stop:1090 length:480 start_codon:yes stop_codon:yes gene_type:complete